MAFCCELQNTLDVEVTQDTLDVEIGGSAGVLLQKKSVEIKENGTSVQKQTASHTKPNGQQNIQRNLSKNQQK